MRSTKIPFTPTRKRFFLLFLLRIRNTMRPASVLSSKAMCLHLSTRHQVAVLEHAVPLPKIFVGNRDLNSRRSRPHFECFGDHPDNQRGERTKYSKFVLHVCQTTILFSEGGELMRKLYVLIAVLLTPDVHANSLLPSRALSRKSPPSQEQQRPRPLSSKQRARVEFQVEVIPQP